MSQCLLLTTQNLVLGLHTFVPEDFGIPGQQSLEEHWHITLGFIVPQVVLQLSGKQTEEQSMLQEKSYLFPKGRDCNVITMALKQQNPATVLR